MTQMRIGSWLLMLLLAGSVYGQNNDRRRFTSDVFNKGRQIRDEASSSLWRKGSWHISPVIGLEQLGYDTNVFSTEDEEIEDFNISPEVGLRTFLRITPTVYWANHASYNYVYYADQEQLRGGEYSGETRLYGLFKKTYFDIGALYRRDRQRINSEVEDRVYSDKLTIDAELVFRPVPRGHLIIKPALYSLRFDESDLIDSANSGTVAFLNSLERDETNLEVRYLHKVKPLFWPFIEVHFDTYDFDTNTGPSANPRDDSERTAVFIGARNEYGKRLHYNIKLGNETLSFDRYGYSPDSAALDEDLFSGRGFISYKITRRFDVEAGGHSQPFFSFNQEYGFYESRRFTVGCGYRFAGKYRLGPEIMIGSNDYPKAFFDTPVDTLRKDDIQALNLVSRIPFGKSLEWRVTLGYMERDSNLAGLSDEGLNVASEVVYKVD